jgi:N-acyl-L-homoserine lactone synthetase
MSLKEFKMQTVCFDLSNFHMHGSAFYEFLALRKKVFVDDLGWDIPHNDSVEMDQYDTPVAHYSLVLKDGKVVGGARAMATTAIWGQHTYMLRDAYSGKLPHIPAHIMSVEIASPKVWECTRLVISDALTTQAERSECLAKIVDGLVGVTRRHHADELICLSSMLLMRALRQLGYDVSKMGETYQNAQDGRHYGVLRMPANYSRMKQLSQSQAFTHPFGVLPEQRDIAIPAYVAPRMPDAPLAQVIC